MVSSSYSVSGPVPFVPLVVLDLVEDGVLKTSRQLSQLFRSRGLKRTSAFVNEAWRTGFAPKKVAGVEDWCSLSGVKEDVLGAFGRIEMVRLWFIVAMQMCTK